MLMLEKLRKIVQDVDSAPNFAAALTTMVNSVRETMGTEVCSVYLLDDRTNRYLLVASGGLNEDAIGNVSLAWNEGLVGLCGAREEPINLDNASAHPKYHYLPETGEEKYNSFLGVPIMHRRKVLGVLVVQQREKRKFDEAEEAFLVTLSAQLSGVVAHAKAIGAFERATLAFFDWEHKEYLPIAVDEQVEVASLTGDIAIGPDGKPALHIHAVLGRHDGSAVAGHLQQAIVRPTLEVILTEAPTYLKKKLDPEIGIALIAPDL